MNPASELGKMGKGKRKTMTRAAKRQRKRAGMANRKRWLAKNLTL